MPDGGTLGPRTRNAPEKFVPDDYRVSTISTGWLDTTQGKELSRRRVFYDTVEDIERKLKHASHSIEVYNAKLDRAMKELTVKQGKDNLHWDLMQYWHEASLRKNPDTTAVLQTAEFIALNAQKDMSWKDVLNSKDRDLALAALDKELSSLEKTILTRIKPDDPEYATAIAKATSGRLLLDVKRSGVYKCRGVKQGFKENLTEADGPNFTYYSHVARLASVRTALFRPRRGTRRIALKDISTAFLQSHGYTEGKKYVCFRHPVTKEWMYYSQSGPMHPLRFSSLICYASS